MSERIDVVRIRQIILDAVGPHSCLLDAKINGLYVVRPRDRAVEMALPMGPKIAQQYANRMPTTTRCEIADLEQAARQGICEGIDRYQPRKLYQTKADVAAGRGGKPVRVDTYLYMWIRKRVFDEIANSHWRIRKPPRTERERYMKGDMDSLEVRHYAMEFLSGVVDLDMQDSAEWIPDANEYYASKHREEMA